MRCLNRVLLEREEVPGGENTVTVTLPAEDYRTLHIRQVLRLGTKGRAEPEKVRRLRSVLLLLVPLEGGERVDVSARMK